MEEFFAGYRKTVMKQDEILRGVSLPLPRGSLRQAFFKRGSRAALTLSRISVACSAVLEEGTLKDVRIEIPQHEDRVAEMEKGLRGEDHREAAIFKVLFENGC